MEVTRVTSKGQVTIPKQVRQQLGIRQGSCIEFVLVGDHVEMRVRSSPAAVPGTGFGMLKTRRKAVPADFDLATLLEALIGLDNNVLAIQAIDAADDGQALKYSQRRARVHRLDFAAAPVPQSRLLVGAPGRKPG